MVPFTPAPLLPTLLLGMSAAESRQDACPSYPFLRNRNGLTARLLFVADLWSMCQQGYQVLLQQRGHAYLGREIEPQITAASQCVLNQEGHFVRQAKLNTVGERRCLAEVDKVLEGEGKGDGLAELDLNSLRRLLYIGMLAQGHGSVANVALGRELDAVLACLDGDYAVPLVRKTPAKPIFSKATYQIQTWPSNPW